MPRTSFIYLLDYVDDIIIFGPSLDALNSLNLFLNSKFRLKDLGQLKYFLRLKISRSTIEIVLSEFHYTLQLLEENDFLTSKPSTPMDSKVKIKTNIRELLNDPSQYRKLIR
ncbi:unnamed protein product [Spirodela intermedia]|uniref:Reverse transcriptase Ty1/copia-type domain-containing protein n=1 Tax=Spirodela intermedia TaxID=51605 RepID=A0A7I8LI22_SPIIN|nr:unnamed protein product [Spirodela intermedia]